MLEYNDWSLKIAQPKTLITTSKINLQNSMHKVGNNIILHDKKKKDDKNKFAKSTCLKPLFTL